jgi:hypothetical protein
LPGVDATGSEPVERCEDAFGAREKLVAPGGVGVGNEEKGGDGRKAMSARRRGKPFGFWKDQNYCWLRIAMIGQIENKTPTRLVVFALSMQFSVHSVQSVASCRSGLQRRCRI